MDGPKSIHRYNQKYRSALLGLDAAAVDPDDDEATEEMEARLLDEGSTDYLHWSKKRDLYDYYIHPDDHDAITQFVQYRDGQDLAVATLNNDIRTLKMAAVRAMNYVDKPLVEFDAERLFDDPTLDPEEQWDLTDLGTLLWHLKHDDDLEEGSLFNYRKILRLFFRRQGKPWFRAIDPTNHASYEYDPDDMITWSEQQAILNGAEGARDKALIALLFDSKQRIGALGTLRVGDVELKDKYGYIKLNDGDVIGLKDADGKVPISWSAAYVANYKNAHPCQGWEDFEDMALFTPGEGANMGTTGEFMTYNSLRKRWIRALENAGLREKYADNPDKLRFHNTRHTGLSELIRDGEGEPRIRQLFAKWHPDSTQFSVYQNVADEDMGDDYLADKGLIDPEENGHETMTFDACPWPSCGVTLPPGEWEFCPGCSRALSQAAVADLRAREEQIDRDLWEDKGGASDPDVEAGVDRMKELLDADDDIRAALVEELADDIRAEVLAGMEDAEAADG